MGRGDGHRRSPDLWWSVGGGVTPGWSKHLTSGSLLFFWVESVASPPELPPRNIPLSTGPCETKELLGPAENPRAPEASRPSLSETLFQRLQTMDTSG